MTSRQLSAIGRRFMRRLEMDEWIARANFRVVRGLKDADGEPLHGESSWHPEERQCWIAVSPGNDEAMTETLLHELLHVLYEGHRPVVGPEYYDETYELGLNRTARALWKEWKDA